MVPSDILDGYAETASFRTYRLDSVNPLHSPDSFIRRALASSGLQSAWTQARLPLGVDSEIDHNSVSEES